MKKWAICNRTLSKAELLTASRYDTYRTDFGVGEVLPQLPQADECAGGLSGERRGESVGGSVEKTWFGIGVGCGEGVQGRREESDETVDK